MQKFEKDNVVLLKELRKLVIENIDATTINPMLEQEVSEYMAEITDKRRYRRLKKMEKALDNFIEEVVSEKNLKKQESLYNEAKLTRTNEAYTAHCNADQ